MTSLFTVRRRADELDAVLEGRRDLVSEELRPLVGVATALREHATTAAPRPEFSVELRARLMAEAERATTPGAPLVLPPRRRERRIAVAASVAVILGGSAGVAAAAQDALPGEALYPLKRGIERAEAGLSVSTEGRGQDLLRQADGRLDEVAGLLSDSDLSASQVPSTLDDFVAQAQEGSDLLLASFEESRDPDTIVTVREFAARGIEALQEIARTAPPEAQSELASAALALKEIDSQAAALCASCGEGIDELELPGIFLTASEVDRVFGLLAQERALDNSHPVIADKRLLRNVTGSVDGVTKQGDSGSGGTRSGGDSPSSSLPQPDPTSEPLIELPSGGDDATKDEAPVRAPLKNPVGDLTDGLSGVAETILPDPDTGLPLG